MRDGGKTGDQMTFRKTSFKGTALAAVAILAPAPLVAHPHIFIDTGIEVIFNDQGLATAVRVTWAYDDLYSLTYLAENGLDADFDGLLTPEETDKLQGFDMAWEPGFAGDSYAFLGETPITLLPPEEPTAALIDGQLTSTHLRQFEQPLSLDAQPFVLRVYDPSYYTAYTIAFPTVLSGRDDCAAQAYEPDRDAADERLEAALAEQAGSADVETDFPAIGDAYAEEVVVTCPAA